MLLQLPRDFLVLALAGLMPAVMAEPNASPDSRGDGRAAEAVVRLLGSVPTQPSPYFPQSVASGDPRSDGVIVWTRVIDLQQPNVDLPVTLEVSSRPDFASVLVQRNDLVARAAHDGCVKVRLAGLQPATWYWYRFAYAAASGIQRSAVGRTKTAPAAGQSPTVRFAFLNCQDYVGRYYNTLAHLVTHEADTLDFVVYLGDYIYETTGDPSFQSTGRVRRIDFQDQTGALSLGSVEQPYYAAASLDNYRELYRTYRSDRLLQRLHELFPVIAIWDDHEYSNDHWREVATYFNGQKSEGDVPRKRNAEQAFFEYLPIEIGLDDHGVKVDAAVLFPQTRIYRDFQFGQRLQLFLTDYRTYRPDHPVAEDAFPGEIVIDEPTATALAGGNWALLRPNLDPYLSVDDPAHAALKAGLTQIVTGAYLAEGLDAGAAGARAAQAVKGNLSSTYINALFQAAGQTAPLPAELIAALPRGLSYLLLGKQSLFTSFGSRYLVPRPTYQLYAAYRASQDPAAQDAYGPAQSAWLAGALGASTAQWKVVGNSVSFAPLVFDFAQPLLPLPPEFPAQLRTQLQLNADSWDGFPQGRQAVIDLLAEHQAVLISGDIHASFVSRHVATGGKVVPEFTGTSVSSETFREELANEVAANPALAGLPGVDQLLAATDLLLRDASTRLPESELLSSATQENGYVILEAGPQALEALYRHWPGALVERDLTALSQAAQLAESMQESRFAATTAAAAGLTVAAVPAGDTNFRLQLLHASDLEGGVNAIQDAPNFAAIVDRFLQTEVPTVVLSAGDNFIPGPFFSAAGDPALRAPLDAVLEAYTGVTGLDIREAIGRADLTIMNVIGFDASALGNHEFDAGTSVLREIIGTDIRGTVPGSVRWLGAQFPYLSANLDFSRDSSLSTIATADGTLPTTRFQSRVDDLAAAAKAPKLAPSAIVTRGGERIGIVGATTPLLAQISSPGSTTVKQPGAGSQDMSKLASILQPVIDALLAQGVNKVILVTHLQQLALEQELVPLLRGVDISIAGGSDSILANAGTALRAGDTAVGPYPILTQNAEGDPALIVSTDGQYKYVGRLVVEFDPAGRVVPGSIDTAASGPWKTDAAGVEAVWGDPTSGFAPGTRGALVRQVTDAVLGVVTAKDATILGQSRVFLEGRRTGVRTEQTNLGDLSADANLAVARTYDPTVAVSIKNGGGIRAEIGLVDGYTGELLPTAANPLSGKQAGEISQLDVENALRFNNTLAVLTVSAAELKDLLEHGVAASRAGATPGQFPQVGGLAFSFDLTRTAIRFDTNGVVTVPGHRVRHLALINAAGQETDRLVENGQVVGNPDRPVRVVTLNFLSTAQATSPGLGGDGYPFPAFAENVVDLTKVLTDPGQATFAAVGSEQDALAEYLRSTYTTSPYAVADTPIAADTRIVNLAAIGSMLNGLALTANGAIISVATLPGRTYVIEFTEAIGSPWQPVPNGTILGTGQPVAVLDPAPVPQATRFYRAVLVQ